jgi:hypothetical protein
MKQKIYILGIVTVLILFTGTIFKINHWAGASVLLVTGLESLILVFLPLALISSFKGEENKQSLLLYIVTWITCFVIFTAMLFKILHWRYAGILLTIALPFPYVVFLPVFLIVTVKNKNFNIYNIVFVLMFLVVNSVISALLSLDVSKERILDSLNIARNYNRMEIVLDQMPSSDHQSPVIVKIDEVLKIVYEYKDIILRHEGGSVEQWKSDPGGSWMPYSGQPASVAFPGSEDWTSGNRLENALKNLVEEMKKTAGYEELANSAADIFNIGLRDESEPPAAMRIFTDRNLSWALIYLDGLETNLKLIKLTN